MSEVVFMTEGAFMMGRGAGEVAWDRTPMT